MRFSSEIIFVYNLSLRWSLIGIESLYSLLGCYWTFVRDGAQAPSRENSNKRKGQAAHLHL